MSFPKPFYRWRPHPWHGLDIGENAPERVNTFIEITPFDSVKYELDKATGYTRVDRPQRTSSQPPTLYGFVPRTFCGEAVAALSPHAKQGDADPLDICVLSERPINRGEIILTAKVVGGLQMVDHGEADDKIIAVLESDHIWGQAEGLSDIPPILIERLHHYFMTYKSLAGADPAVEITEVYDSEHARKVVEASMRDYLDEYGG